MLFAVVSMVHMAGPRVHEETPAQQKARQEADLKIRAGAFWRFWSWGATFNKKQSSSESKATSAFWKNLFGRASTSVLFTTPVPDGDVAKVREPVPWS